jgi:hypothetical protein
VTLLAERLPSIAAPPISATGYELSKRGVIFHRGLSLEEYEALGRRIAVVANATAWQLGDWLVAGTGRYEEAGETYRRLHELTGRSFDTIRTWLKVSLAYSHTERGLVPWTLYREALRLPAKERVDHLRIAATNEWTSVGFASFVAKRLDSDRDPLEPSAEAVRDTRPTRRGGARQRVVSCPHCGGTFAVPPRTTTASTLTRRTAS